MTTFKEWQVYNEGVNKVVNQYVNDKCKVDDYNVRTSVNKRKALYNADCITSVKRKSRIRQQDFYDYARNYNALRKLNTKTLHKTRQEDGVKFTADVYTTDGKTLHFNRKGIYNRYVNKHSKEIVKLIVNEYKTINYNVVYK